MSELPLLVTPQFYHAFLAWVETQPDLTLWHERLQQQLSTQLSVERWGDLPHWQATLDNLPDVTAATIELKNKVSIGSSQELAPETSEQLKTLLMAMHPWRKGPFELFDLTIDTEWRSDWKWRRVLPHLPPLQDQLVLDVGCGNGYHCLRIAGEGAERVIGIDPSPKFVYQFYALKKYMGDIPVDVLPLGIEHMPEKLPIFDTVFSMGVLYHRRSPMDHLKELFGLLKPGGKLVVETLIIDGELGSTLVPEGRYGKMRNVWFLPSAKTLISWLRKSNFRNPKLVDTCRTTTEEQRRTEWMHFESLQDFLDPENPNLTIEGHPAPLRAVFIAEKPE